LLTNFLTPKYYPNKYSFDMKILSSKKYISSYSSFCPLSIKRRSFKMSICGPQKMAFDLIEI
jgi:hypothetical protein